MFVFLHYCLPITYMTHHMTSHQGVGVTLFFHLSVLNVSECASMREFSKEASGNGSPLPGAWLWQFWWAIELFTWFLLDYIAVFHKYPFTIELEIQTLCGSWISNFPVVLLQSFFSSGIWVERVFRWTVLSAGVVCSFGFKKVTLELGRWCSSCHKSWCNDCSLPEILLVLLQLESSILHLVCQMCVAQSQTLKIIRKTLFFKNWTNEIERHIWHKKCGTEDFNLGSTEAPSKCRFPYRGRREAPVVRLQI